MNSVQSGCSICQNLFVRADEPGFVDIYSKDRRVDNTSHSKEQPDKMEVGEDLKIEPTNRKPVKIQSLPSDLISIIFTKMDQITFTRMRRTNKRMSSFIEENRQNLKVPLFHNWRATVRCEGIILANALLDVSKFSIGKNLNYAFDETHDIPTNCDVEVRRNEKYENPLEIKPVRNEVKVFILAWKLNEKLRKEFTGNIRFSRFEISRMEPYFHSTWLEFITSNISSISLSIYSVPQDVITHCLNKLKPKSLTIYSSDTITLGSDLEYVKSLTLKEVKVRLDYKSLKNAEVLEVKEPTIGETWFDALEMVKMWCSGGNDMRKMLYSGKVDTRQMPQGQPVQEHEIRNELKFGRLICYGESLEKHVVDAFLQPGGLLYKMAAKLFSRNLQMNQGPQPKAFALTQMTSNKRAICLRYNADILFAVVENEDFFNVPKPEEPKDDAAADVDGDAAAGVAEADDDDDDDDAHNVDGDIE